LPGSLRGPARQNRRCKVATQVIEGEKEVFPSGEPVRVPVTPGERPSVRSRRPSLRWEVRHRGAEGCPEGGEGLHRGADLRYPGGDGPHFGVGDPNRGGAVATSVAEAGTPGGEAPPGVREVLTWVTKVRIRLEKDRRLKGRLTPPGSRDEPCSSRGGLPRIKSRSLSSPSGDSWRSPGSSRLSASPPRRRAGT
jgi:hypothetical protein